MNLPKDLIAETMLKIVLCVLHTHYTRQSQVIKEILDGFHELHHPKLQSTWEQIHQRAGSSEQALALFTEWVEATLDGGNLTLPD